jgi:hypothetical protein
VSLVKTHQKLTVKPTPNRSSSDKPDPAECGFSNQKPTPTHTIPTSNDYHQRYFQKIELDLRLIIIIEAMLSQ